MQNKVRSARLRYLLVLLAEQTVLVLSILLCIRVGEFFWRPRLDLAHLCLSLGVVGASIIAAGYRIKRRFPSSYQIAQLLDGRAGLRDSFSTAWFLLAHPSYPTTPYAAAHIARANDLLSEMRLRDLFPVPLRSLLVVASLSGALVLTGWRNVLNLAPGKTQATSRHNSETKLGIDSSFRSVAGELSDRLRSLQTSGQRGAHSPASAGDEPGLTAQSVTPLTSLGPAQSSRLDGEVQSPGPHMDANLPRNHPVRDEFSNGNNTVASAGPRAPVDRPSGANRQMMPPDDGQGASGIDPYRSGDRTTDASPSPESLLSKLFSPIKRLLDAEAAPSDQAAIAVQKGSTPSATNKVDAGHRPGLASASIPRDRMGPLSREAEYASADISSQLANPNPVTVTGNIGGYVSDAELNSPAPFAVPRNVTELVLANSYGDRGYTRVQASRAAPGGRPVYSSGVSHDADSGQEIPRDSVPLRYQRSIQAYLEHNRDQAGKSPEK